ncbi:MAG TPA: hypothetical protein VER55_02805 [Ardenticatenaceae bacterium]|nr:hypothetical protein [Ardenticatenaceae bacterium]
MAGKQTLAALLVLIGTLACGLPPALVRRPPAATATIARPAATSTPRVGPTESPRPSVTEVPRTAVAASVPATATPVPTAATPPGPTPAPTWTPAPLPTLAAAPDEAEGAELLIQTGVLDVYVFPDVDPALRDWLLGQPERFDEITRSIEQRLATRLERRIVLLVKPPEAGREVRANCPARGAALRSEDGTHLIYLFADATTSEAQKEAVVAHEIAHQAIFTKLGPGGGDVILNEGLANWAIPQTWEDWQGAPSYDSFVLESLATGAFVPLTESVARNFAMPEEGEDCFETRDQVYNEWASFVDFLIRRYGWGAIRRFWTQDVEQDEERDYTVGFGKSLAELEREWLAGLGRGVG